MTKDGAQATARGMATRFGKTFVIYRCEWWPAGEYKILADDDDLEMGAQIVERCDPVRPGATPAATDEGMFQFHDPD